MLYEVITTRIEGGPPGHCRKSHGNQLISLDRTNRLKFEIALDEGYHRAWIAVITCGIEYPAFLATHEERSCSNDELGSRVIVGPHTPDDGKSVAPRTRITSYNVCYTKLLRSMGPKSLSSYKTVPA